MNIRGRLLEADEYNRRHSVRDPLHLEAAQALEEQGKKAAAIEAIASEMLEAWYDGADGDDVLGTYAKRLWEALSANPKP